MQVFEVVCALHYWTLLWRLMHCKHCELFNSIFSIFEDFRSAGVLWKILKSKIICWKVDGCKNKKIMLVTSINLNPHRLLLFSSSRGCSRWWTPSTRRSRSDWGPGPTSRDHQLIVPTIITYYIIIITVIITVGNEYIGIMRSFLSLRSR